MTRHVTNQPIASPLVGGDGCGQTRMMPGLAIPGPAPVQSAHKCENFMTFFGRRFKTRPNGQENADGSPLRPSSPDPSEPGLTQNHPGQLPAWLFSTWFLGFLLSLLVILVYSNSLHGAFLYDDYVDVLENQALKHLWPLRDVFGVHSEDGWALYSRPIVMLSFAINRAIGGIEPYSYHLTNLGIHLCATLALFGTVRRTLALPRLRDFFSGRATLLAFAIALLWGLHPLQTESVSYVTQRYESLTGLFVLLTFYCVARLPDTPRPQGWSLLAALACLLALGSKEVAASVPFLVLLYDRAFLTTTFREALRRHTTLYLGLLLAWSCFLVIQLLTPARGWAGFEGSVPWWRYAMSQPGVILHYLRLSFWPHPLCLDYAWPLAQTWRQALPGLCSIGLLILFSLWALVRKPWLGFLAMFFFLILAPTSSVVPINDLAVEHRMYLPLAPVVVLTVLGVYRAGTANLRLARLLDTKPGSLLALFLMIGVPTALGILTYARNEDYKSPLNIWQDSVTKAPANPRARYNYAYHLAENRFYDEALRQYKMVVERVPNSPIANSGYGRFLEQLGRYQEAIPYLRNALLLEPGEAKHYVNLAAALYNNRSIEASLICNRRAVKMDPDIPEAHNGLGLGYQNKKKYDLALSHFRKAVELKPKNTDFRLNLGTLLLIYFSKDEAIKEFNIVIKLDPNNVESISRLGWIFYQHQDFAEAVRILDKALKIQPDHIRSLKRLAWIRAACPDAPVRNGPEAVRLAEKAMQLDRTRSPESLNLLAMAQAESGLFKEAQATLKEALLQATNQEEQWVIDARARQKLFEKRQAFRDFAPDSQPSGMPKKGVAS